MRKGAEDDVMEEHIFYLDEGGGHAQLCTPGPDGSCALCGDEGIEGTIVALLPKNMALVDLPDRQTTAAVDLIESPRPGDRIIVHLGFAIARIREESGP